MDDWQIERHDDEIQQLKERLYRAENEIRDLERRPFEWLFKAQLAFCWLLIFAIWIYAIVEIANKHH